MSPAITATAAAGSPTPPAQHRTLTKSTDWDEVFQSKLLALIARFREDPRAGGLTQKDRKEFIDQAYSETDEIFFAGRSLSDNQIKMRAMTKVFTIVLAEEPWSDEWIKPADVERKLSRFEMHKDSVKLAAKHGLHTARDAIGAARRHFDLNVNNAESEIRTPRGPYDDIEVIFIPGTVSSTATNRINRETTYPVSVSSVANILSTHMCRRMTTPYAMAEKFVTSTDKEWLLMIRQQACDICDFAPHLLDNDNASLLIVLLILTRSEVCKRFDNNGIRLEGSTISHRRAECVKQKFGWKNAEERKPFDSVSIDLQTRVKNAWSPAPRARRAQFRCQVRRTPRPSIPTTATTHGPPSTPVTPSTPARQPIWPSFTPSRLWNPPIGYYAAPQVPVRTGRTLRSPEEILKGTGRAPFAFPPPPQAQATEPGNSAEDPMDLS
ncbi:hypothetical protein BDV95DRAFT_558938 [Massariosphaeria phaeospora]|uniref:Uncharacterized protein n=1 Tax=Massariosphaeria phaeospora TaxID=100035 RepID=A0A7C8IEG5_9PLEO|nr:hypothetical protein BDV95DRAFT_558938 [Massariosphaeria phaeospora]